MIPFTPKSKRSPPHLNLCPNVELFVKLVTEDLKSIPSVTAANNLTTTQQALLQERKDIIIKPADKGGNIVLWPVSMYERDAFRQLRDTKMYRRLTFNPLSSFQEELTSLIDNAFQKGLITKGPMIVL